MNKMFLLGAVVVALSALHVGAASPQEGIKVSIYRLSEQDACGPAGYQRTGQRTCTIRWNKDRLIKLKYRLTLIRENVSIPPPEIRFNPSQVSPILTYSDAAADLPLARRESALIVVEWTDREIRDFRVNRPSSPKVAGRKKPYALPAKPRGIAFYHEPLDHIDPEKGVLWSISSCSSKYKLSFVR
jgi:hypothetical protein